MVDFNLIFDASPTIYEDDDITEVQWSNIGFDKLKPFPQERRFELAGLSWAVEGFNYSGRYGDRFMFHIMQLIDGIPIPALDMTLQEGIQITVDNKIRLYVYKLNPKLIDNYLSTDSTGTYTVFVSEV